MAQTEPALDEVNQQHQEPFYWLNEDSRAFLDEGYLIEGVTAGSGSGRSRSGPRRSWTTTASRTSSTTT